MTGSAASKRFEPRTAALAGALIFVIYLSGFFLAFPLLGLKLDDPLLHQDADSNVRLAQIHAFLAGQDWFDLELKRYGLEGGTSMHWTRLADLLPSGLISLMSLVLPRATAEHITIILAPGLLLIPYVFALIWLTHRLVPEFSTRALTFAIVAVGIQLPNHLKAFGPGRLDHHNLQLIAILVLLGGMVGQRNFKSGLISACGLVGGLVVGLDSIPILLGALGVLSLLWVFDARRERDFIFGLGLGIAALTPILGIVFIPRPDLGRWCDSWTLPLSTIIFGFGIYLLGVSWLTSRIDNRWIRTGVAGCVGALWLSLLLSFNRACLSPLPIPKGNVLVDRYWFTYVGENHSIWQDFIYDPRVADLHVLGLLVMAVYAWTLLRKREAFAASALYAGAFLGAIAFAALYLRGLQLLNALLLPALAIVVLRVSVVLKGKRPLVRAMGVLFPAALTITIATAADVAGTLPSVERARAKAAGIVLSDLDGGFEPNGITGPYANIDPEERITNCLGEAQLAAVNRLTPGRVLTEFGSNEYWLAKTQHHTVFGGYHRNAADNIEILTLLTSSDEVARSKLAAWRIDYLNYCVSDGQFDYLARDYPDSFIGHVTSGKRPSWLVPVVPLRHGMVFKIVPSGLAHASHPDTGVQVAVKK